MASLLKLEGGFFYEKAKGAKGKRQRTKGKGQKASTTSVFVQMPTLPFAPCLLFFCPSYFRSYGMHTKLLENQEII